MVSGFFTTEFLATEVVTAWPDLLVGDVVDEFSDDESIVIEIFVSVSSEREVSKFASAFVGRPIECVSSLDVALGFSWPHAAVHNVAPAINPIAQCLTPQN